MNDARGKHLTDNISRFFACWFIERWIFWYLLHSWAIPINIFFELVRSQNLKVAMERMDIRVYLSML